MDKYRVAPHIFSGNNAPCYKIEERHFIFWWNEYRNHKGDMPIWWDYEQVKKVCNHMNGKGEAIENKPKKRKPKLRAVK